MHAGPPIGPLLLVSPHLDDAALSCAALLARDEPVDVLNAFAGDPDLPRQGEWDRLCGFASSAESGAARRREEEAAFGGSQHRVTMMGLLDWQYAELPRGPDEGAEIGKAVVDWAAPAGAGTVAIPAGAGWRPPGRLLARIERAIGRRLREPESHPDHLFVRDAVLGAVSEHPKIVPLLYEELPYAWGATADREVTRTAAAWRRRVTLFVMPVDRIAKAARLVAYTSQLPNLCADGRRLDDPAVLPAVERYWRLDLLGSSSEASLPARHGVD